MGSQWDIVLPRIAESHIEKNKNLLMAKDEQWWSSFAKRQDEDWLAQGRKWSTPHLILDSSPKRLRDVVEICARYFRRQFGYDFINYSAEQDPRYRVEREAWLWTEGTWEIYAAGHAVFYKRDEHWELSSIWIHPWMQRKGRLTDAWPIWKERYGPFDVQGPWSKAMAGFLRKTNDPFPDGTCPLDYLDGFTDWTLLELRRELNERGLTPWDSREALALRLSQDDS